MKMEFPHRRMNILTGEWILVSPQRAKRPWLGQVEKVPPEDIPAYDPDCYLCPGNPRAGGACNPAYISTFVFDNDFPALLAPERAAGLDTEIDLATYQTTLERQSLFLSQPESGICRVVCFSPRHDLSLPELSLQEVEAVIRTWTEQTEELGSLDFIGYVQVFENRGAIMGASNPHPHSQIWASSHIPNEPAKELRTQTEYLHEHKSCLLCSYLEAERRLAERVVVSNDHFTILVPFWAIWPFETLLVSHRHAASLKYFTPTEVSALADILRQIVTRYDNLFEISFPYSMGFHQAPAHLSPNEEWHFHAHFYPPLLRSATVRKFMVGYELLSTPQRDLTPETAAERLRGLSGIHYRHQASP